MKKIIKIITILSLLLVFFTEAAFAASVKIGVIDTGVKKKEGIIDQERILPGKNYVLQNDDTDDEVGHGTRVTGLIIGTLDGEIVSPCKEGLIVPLVYYTKLASGAVLNGGIENVCNAIYDAVDTYDCQIINISSGVPQENEALKRAVDYAEEQGVLIVSACGNDGKDVYYPAAYDTVLGVGSLNKQLEPADFSSQGNGLDMLIDGEDLKVVSIKNAADYESISGTSYSAALITSYAAAAFEQYPYIMPTQLRYLMRVSCEDICDAGYDEQSGYGIFSPERFSENLRLFDQGEIVCFYDVSETDWFYDSVKKAYHQGWLNGTGDGIFDPDGDITRAMFVSILYRAEGQPQTNHALKFDDVAENTYYTEAVGWALENGIVAGVSDTTFVPERNITREEMAAVMSRYADYRGIKAEERGDLTRFDDTHEISGWAMENMSWAVGAGLISGKGDGILDPLGSTTRAEAATILYRFLGR